MFVKQSDKDYLKTIGVDYDKDINVFIKEIKEFFMEVWREEFMEDIKKIETIEDLNTYLSDYPSTGGKEILDSTFIFVTEEQYNIFSEKSKKILYHFYNHLPKPN